MTTMRVLRLKAYLALFLAVPVRAHEHVALPPHDGAGQLLANG